MTQFTRTFRWLAAFLFAAGGAALADTETWRGAVNGLWSQAGSWTAAGGQLVFPGATANQTNTTTWRLGRSVVPERWRATRKP
jgi:hypothetical protein